MESMPNIILIILDTARKDAISTYVNDLNMPNLENFARECRVYDSAISPSPWTFPAHMSIFTGKYPSEHGIHETFDKKVTDLVENGTKPYQSPMLAEYLQELGYNTVAISANPMISESTGMGRGFDEFLLRDAFYGVSVLDEELRSRISYLKSNGVVRQDTIDQSSLVSQLLRQMRLKELLFIREKYKSISKKLVYEGYPKAKGAQHIQNELNAIELRSPFFLYINMMEMHDPHIINSRRNFYFLNENNIMLKDLFGFTKIKKKKIDLIREGYFDTSSVLDTYLGNILSILKKKSDFRNTLLIVTSDHGQELHENGYFGHGIFLSDELVKIPLLVKYPKKFYVETQISREKYQSTTDLFELMINTAGGMSIPLKERDFVFSESFGIQQDIMTILKEKVDMELFKSVRERLDYRRKAIFKDGYKLIYNCRDRIIDELTLNGKSIDPIFHEEKANSLLSAILDGLSIPSN